MTSAPPSARFSATVLAVLPAGFFLVFPGSAAALATWRGAAAAGLGLALNAAGYLVLRSLSHPDRYL